jgi:transcriptional regulator with XRE-family HTH domain
MGLKEIFIANLKKFRREEKISQMKLAEKCNTAASYIGEIEIGRKFPSIEMIEKIAGALEVEPYRFFVDESAQKTGNEKFVAYFESLPADIRQNVINSLMDAIGDGLRRALKPENESKDAPQRPLQTGEGGHPEKPRKRKK